VTTTWKTLFERAAAYDVSPDDVTAALAERRADGDDGDRGGPSGTDETERGGD
jgi:hypothetical protein